MFYFAPWKVVLIIVTCVASVLLTLPNFFAKETVAGWPDWVPKRQMPLGLDLRGGAHLLYQMDTAALRKDWLTTVRLDARNQLRDAKLAFSAIGVTPNGVQVRLAKPEDQDKALVELKKLIETMGNPLIGASDRNLSVTATEGSILVTPTDAGMRQRVTDATSAAIETVRKRVDPSGTVEATVLRQGADRILVQVPGIEDTKELKDRIGQTAKLTFHDVHPQGNPERDRTLAQPPPGYMAVPSDDAAGGEYILDETPVVSGEDLVDAQPGFDQYNRPAINFRFDQSGARKFGKFTQDHVDMPFAIVLDGKVLSAPDINEPILGGSGQITGDGFTVESTKNLAIQLRSGALPAKLTVIEERTVGPSLGADSIEAGKRAVLIGFFGVTLFMVACYGVFGIFAILALAINIFLIFAALSVLGATLTLPGIAGIVLTMGMSVDANVLINERIRDELRIGKSPISALDTGFRSAYGTIFDTNMTALLAAVVLIIFGSGPVKGFGVTFAIGVLASAFTATTITRYLVALWYRQTRPKIINI